MVKAGHDDVDYSAGKVERLALRRLLEDIEAGQIDILVVYKVDRLIRRLADSPQLVRLQWCELRIDHPAVQQNHFDGAALAQQPAVLRAIGARGDR